jgi:hypothetical protein
VKSVLISGFFLVVQEIVSICYISAFERRVLLMARTLEAGTMRYAQRSFISWLPNLASVSKPTHCIWIVTFSSSST